MLIAVIFLFTLERWSRRQRLTHAVQLEDAAKMIVPVLVHPTADLQQMIKLEADNLLPE